VFTPGLCKACRSSFNANPKKPNALDGVDSFGGGDGTVIQIAWRGKVSTGQEIIFTLLTDDGNPSRSRRGNLLDPQFKFAGIYAGPEGDDFVCVLLLASNWTDK